MHVKLSNIAFVLMGLNFFLSSLIILNELRFTFYRFYTPMLMNPTLINSNIDFVIWSSSSIIILIGLSTTLIKLEKRLIKKPLLTLTASSIFSAFLLLFNFKLTFLVLIFWFIFLALIYLVNLRLKINKVKLLSLISSLPLFLVSLITFLSSLFLLLHLKHIYPLPVELEGKIAILNIQVFYALYPLNTFFLLLLSILWIYAPLTSFLKLNVEFNFFNRFKLFPLIASLILSVVLIELPYLTRVVFIGVDAQWYFKTLNQIKNPKTILSMFTYEPRSFYLTILWFTTLLGFSKETAVKIGPAILSIIHTIAVFAFIYVITKNKFLSGLSSLFAIFSFQAIVGMYAGIYANWLSLSTAILSLTFLIKAIKKNLKFIIPSICLLIISNISHPWFAAINFLILILYALISLIYSAMKKFKEGLREFLCILSLITVNVTLIVFAFIKHLRLMDAIQINQILQSIKLLNVFSFFENLDFALKFYVGGFFITPLIYLLGLASTPLIFKNKILFKLFTAWFITTLLLLIFSDLWLKWRILYLMPFQILSGLGYIVIMKNLHKTSLTFKTLFSTAIFLQLFNYTLQCLLFIPEY